MTLPNFFIIGAPKSGSTALYDAVAQHPDIYMSPEKEPLFFAFEGQPPVYAGPNGRFFRRHAVWRPDQYLQLFAGRRQERVVGEASSNYISSPLAARRIRQSLPDSKLVAILRQPAERAYSQYNSLLRWGWDARYTFVEALRHEEAGLRDNWLSSFHYKRNGFYGAQLALYYDMFPREQIKIYLYEDFTRRADWLLRDLFEFLEVDPGFTPQVRKKNVSLAPSRPLLNRMAQQNGPLQRRLAPFLPAADHRALFSGLERFNMRYNLGPAQPLDPQLRRWLTAEFREDILKLQALIGRDLSHWL